MSERYETLKPGIAFRSTKIEGMVLKLWQNFFARIAKLPVPIDRAIWIFNYYPSSVAVKPGKPDDDVYEEPHFVLSALITGFEEEGNAIQEKTGNYDLNSPAMKKYYAAYDRWLRDAVKTTFQSPQIEKLREKYGKKIAVYWSNVEDLHTTEIGEMKWLVGSKLK